MKRLNSFYKVHKRIACVLLFFSFFLYSQTYSSIKGSESALSVEPFYTFLSTETDNTMLGFGWFKNGFALDDVSTSCTFNSVFPVSGDVYLNGGDLSLLQDLNFKNITTWYTPGIIYGNDYLVDLSSSISGFGSGNQVFDNSQIAINGDLTISGSIKFKGDCLFNGNGKRILLDTDGYILIDNNATVKFKNVHIDGIVDGKICCLGDASRIVLDDVWWDQDGDYSFTKGSFTIRDQVDFLGSYTFSYESNNTSTVAANSAWRIADAMEIKLGRSGGIEPLYLENSTSILHLDNCVLGVGSEGVCFTRGALLCHHKVIIDLDSTSSTNGIRLGNGIASDNIDLIIEAGAAVHFLKGHLSYDVTKPNCLVARGSGSQLVRYGGTNFYMNEDIELSNISVIDKNVSAAMTPAAGKSITYDNVTLEWPGAGLALTGKRYNFYTNLLSGDDELLLMKGLLTAYTQIEGTGNLIHGNGSLSGPITLSDGNAEVQFRLNGPLIEDVNLNGGTVTLLKDLSIRKAYGFSGSGTVNLGTNHLRLGMASRSWTGAIYWDGDSSHIDFRSTIELSETWTFSGNCTLHGNTNTLKLLSGGEIVVEKGSTLTFKDVLLKDVSGNQIRCLDSNSQIIFNNAAIKLDGNYSFTQGSFSTLNVFEISNSYTFDYQSVQQSTIGSKGVFEIRKGATFSYNPLSDSRDLLKLGCSDAKIKLVDSTLHSTTTGLQLTKGIIDIKGDSFISSDATIPENGITFGDGILESNDIEVNVLSNADVEFSGEIVNKNIN